MQKIIAVSTCFLQKIDISSNKPSTTLQKFRCTLTNLNTADEVTRIDGTELLLLVRSSGADSLWEEASPSRGPPLIGWSLNCSYWSGALAWILSEKKQVHHKVHLWLVIIELFLLVISAGSDSLWEKWVRQKACFSLID